MTRLLLTKINDTIVIWLSGTWTSEVFTIIYSTAKSLQSMIYIISWPSRVWQTCFGDRLQFVQHVTDNLTSCSVHIIKNVHTQTHSIHYSLTLIIITVEYTGQAWSNHDNQSSTLNTVKYIGSCLHYCNHLILSNRTSFALPQWKL